MLNIIWTSMMLISFVTAAVSGNMEATMSALLDSGTKAIELLISIGGIMAICVSSCRLKQELYQR